MKKLLPIATAALALAPAGSFAASRDRTPPSVQYRTANGATLLGGVDAIAGGAYDRSSGIRRVEVTAIPCNTQASDEACGYTGVRFAQQRTGSVTLTCDTSRRACTWSAVAPAAPGTYWVAATAYDRAGNESSHGGILRIVVV